MKRNLLFFTATAALVANLWFFELHQKSDTQPSAHTANPITSAIREQESVSPPASASSISNNKATQELAERFVFLGSSSSAGRIKQILAQSDREIEAMRQDYEHETIDGAEYARQYLELEATRQAQLLAALTKEEKESYIKQHSVSAQMIARMELVSCLAPDVLSSIQHLAYDSATSDLHAQDPGAAESALALQIEKEHGAQVADAWVRRSSGMAPAFLGLRKSLGLSTEQADHLIDYALYLRQTEGDLRGEANPRTEDAITQELQTAAHKITEQLEPMLGADTLAKLKQQPIWAFFDYR